MSGIRNRFVFSVLEQVHFSSVLTSHHLLWKVSGHPHPLCLRQAHRDGPELTLLLSCLFSSVGILGVPHTQLLHFSQFRSEPMEQSLSRVPAVFPIDS